MNEKQNEIGMMESEHHYGRKVPISVILCDLSSQENCDGFEYDVMYKAAKYIEYLEHTINKRTKEITVVTDIQTSEGNWNHDPYMHGMANGLLLAKSIMAGSKVDFLDPPEEWGKDKTCEPLATEGENNDFEKINNLYENKE